MEKDNKWEIPGLLRLRIWLGLEKQESEWRKMQTDGDLAVFAETVSNILNSSPMNLKRYFISFSFSFLINICSSYFINPKL